MADSNPSLEALVSGILGISMGIALIITQSFNLAGVWFLVAAWTFMYCLKDISVQEYQYLLQKSIKSTNKAIALNEELLSITREKIDED